MRKYINDGGEEVYSILVTKREMSLLANLTTQHIRTLEGLMENDPPILPEHKDWMYILEDKLEI
jgi:hypothetical protein